MRPAPPILEYALLGLLATLWGSSYLFIRVAVGEIGPVTLIAARVGIAALLLTGLAWVMGHRLPRGGTVWARLGLQSFLNAWGAWTLLAWGQQFVASGLAGVLNSTAPVFVALFGIVAGTTGGRRALGALVGLGGVVLIVGPEVLGGIGERALAQGAVLAGAILYAIAVMHGRHFAGLHPVVTAAGTMTAASAVLIPASLALEAPWRLAPSATALVAAGALGVLSTALALTIYFRLIHTLGPLGTASQAYLRAGLSVALGMAILGERPDALTAAGLATAILGVVLINWPARR